MNIFRKQFRHSALSTALLVLLLVIGVAFCAIGLAAWITMQEQLTDMKGQYTTVAVPSGKDVIAGNDNLLDVEGDWKTLLGQEERDYPGACSEDVRGFLTAHVSGCESVSPYERNYFSSELFDAYNNSMMVLAVRCTSVLDATASEIFLERPVRGENSEIIGYEEVCEKRYDAYFTLEGAVCRFPGYDTIPKDVVIRLYSGLYTEDGRIPFEPGKTYLVFGIDQGLVISFEGLSEEIDGEAYFFDPEEILVEEIATDQILVIGSGSVNYSYDTGNQFFSWHGRNDADGKRYYTLNEDSLPFYAEYEGDWRDFLESEEGRAWREEVIPWCRLNHESVAVIMTDNIDSLYLFNKGDADILAGRKFQEEEYADGDAVCMVSAAYAVKNDISVGDTINLDLYRSELNYQLEFAGGSSPSFEPAFEPIWVQEPCASKNRIGVQKDYAIVGIYTAPEFLEGWHNFQADTIFIPKASVPNAKEYEIRSNILMYSVILENGMEDEFEAYVSAMGYGGQFVYSDQGYHEALDSFKVLLDNALRLALIGGGVFLLTTALFLFLAFRQTMPTILGVRRLGMEQKAVRKELLQALMVLISLASLPGAGLGYALYKTVTGRALKGTAPVQPQTIVLCVVAEILLLLAAACVCSCLMTNRGLMDWHRVGKKRNKKSGTRHDADNRTRREKEEKREKGKRNLKMGSALWQVTLVAMWRRKRISLLLVMVAAVSVFFAVFVQNLAGRQEAAIERMIRDTGIRCVVTDARGANMDYLRMPNGFVDRLMGMRHEQGCFLDEFVKNVRAKASATLKYPNDVTLRRILNFASDPALDVAEGGEIRMLDGWTEEAFLSEDKVCLVSEGMRTREDEEGNAWVEVVMEDGVELNLQVIGTVSGGSGDVIWCPFYLRRQEGISELVWVDSCSFDIADNTKLEECKAAIYELFVEPGPSTPKDDLTFGVLVQDETYQSTLEKLRNNLFLLRLLLPILTALCIAVGFLAGYLTTRTRLREFAVMRCLGMKRETIFIRTFGEYLLLSAVGTAVGSGAGFLVEGGVSCGALARAGLVLGFFLAGAAVSVWNVTHVNVMKLMKTEE